jgi:hypothetical protein
MANNNIEEFAISLPFYIDAYGSVAATSSQEKIWMDRVKIAINTSINERTINMALGTTISSEVFNSQDVASNTVIAEINRVFDSQFPLLRLNTVDVSFDESTSTCVAEIYFSIPDGRDASLIIGTAAMIDGNIISEDQ